MPGRSLAPRLVDMVQACERIRALLQDMPLDAFEADWLRARHTYIPRVKVAGIGNVLRHNYEYVAPDILWKLAQSDLPELERVCRDELALERAKGVT